MTSDCKWEMLHKRELVHENLTFTHSLVYFPLRSTSSKPFSNRRILPRLQRLEGGLVASVVSVSSIGRFKGAIPGALVKVMVHLRC